MRNSTFALNEKMRQALREAGCDIELNLDEKSLNNAGYWLQSFGLYPRSCWTHQYEGLGHRYWVDYIDEKTGERRRLMDEFLPDKGWRAFEDEHDMTQIDYTHEAIICWACDYLINHREDCHYRELVFDDGTRYADYLRISHEYRNDGNLTGLDDR